MYWHSYSGLVMENTKEAAKVIADRVKGHGTDISSEYLGAPLLVNIPKKARIHILLAIFPIICSTKAKQYTDREGKKEKEVLCSWFIPFSVKSQHSVDQLPNRFLCRHQQKSSTLEEFIARNYPLLKWGVTHWFTKIIAWISSSPEKKKLLTDQVLPHIWTRWPGLGKG